MNKETFQDDHLLKKKIVQGNNIIQINPKQTNVVLFIGDTGVGKSTIINYLIGNQLEVKMVNLKMSLVCSKQEVKIGHQKISQTSLPTKVTIKEGLVLYDYPGFDDNRSIEAEIVNSFYHKFLISYYENIKIVVVIDESYLTQCQADKMPSLINKLNNAFGNLSQIQLSTLFMINKCDPENTIEGIYQQFQKYVNTKDLFTIQQIIKHKSIFCFNRPRKQLKNTTIGNQQRQGILRQIQSLGYMNRTNIKNIISDVSQLHIRNYLDILLSETEIKVSDTIKNLNNQLQKNMKSAQFLNYVRSQIVKLLGEKNGIKSNNFQPFFNFCNQMKIDPQTFQIFKQSLLVVQFFSNTYPQNKTKTFYLLITSYLMNGLSVLLNDVEHKIQQCSQQNSKKGRRNNHSKDKQNQEAPVQMRQKNIVNLSQNKNRPFTNQVIGGSEANYLNKS